MGGLTDVELDSLWEAIEGAYLDTTTWSRESEDNIKAVVERIVAERERMAAARALQEAARDLPVLNNEIRAYEWLTKRADRLSRPGRGEVALGSTGALGALRSAQIESRTRATGGDHDVQV